MTYLATHVVVEPTTNKELPIYDFSTLNAVEQCPKWGIVRYVHQKAFPSDAEKRQLALEAGTAMHSAWAAIRLMWLLKETGNPDLFVREAKRIFKDKAEEIFGPAMRATNTPLEAGLNALACSGYYDDPRDRKRTLNNMEEALMYAVASWPFGHMPISIIDDFVGIEQTIDVTITYLQGNDVIKQVRYAGRIDGLHWSEKMQTHVVLEHKHVSRVNASWEAGMRMSPQPIGYAIGMMARQIECKAIVPFGVQLPLPTRVPADGISSPRIDVTSHAIETFFKWVYEQHDIIVEHKDVPEYAPERRHSCNRYFSECQFLDALCSESFDEQKETIANDMIVVPWNPLDD